MHTTAILDRLETARTLLIELRMLRSGGGNPNHAPAGGPHGGEFASGHGSGGQGKHAARKARKKQLARLRKEAHGKSAKLRAKHRKEIAKVKHDRWKAGKPSGGAVKDLRDKHWQERKRLARDIKADIHAKAGGAPSGKKAEAFREAKTKPLTDLRKRQLGERKELIAEQKGEWHDLHKEHRGERKALASEARKARNGMREDYHAERKELIASKQEEHRTEVREANREHAKRERNAAKKIDAAIAAGKPKAAKRLTERLETIRAEHKANIAEIHATNKEALRDEAKYLKDSHKEAISEHKEQYAADKKELRKEHHQTYREKHKEHQEARDEVRKTEREERKEVVTEIRARLKTGRTREGRSYGKANEVGRRTLDQDGNMQWDYDPGEQRQGDDLAGDRGLYRAAAPGGRFGRQQTHKASSAEAILSHCLKRRGWTRQWRDGTLTGQQHLTLLEDVRQYGRAWLRHEAEEFFEAYGVSNGHRGRFDLETRSAISDNPENSRAISDGSERAGNPTEMVSRSLGGRLLSPLKRFFDRARSFVRELIVAGTLALKGPEPLTAAETAAVDQAAKVQAEYLDNFQRQVIANPPAVLIDPADLQATSTILQPPPMSPGQFVARAELYANAAHQTAQKIIRQSVIDTAAIPGGPINPLPAFPILIAKYERRVLGIPKFEHCGDCPPLAALGWQPLGTLPGIGDSACNGLCLCHFEYTDNLPLAGAKPKISVNGKHPRKIKLKRTPNTAYQKILRQPTHDEVKAEVDKWLAGKPSQIAITPPGTPPVVPGTINPQEGGGWKTPEGMPAPGFRLPPMPPDQELPPGYEWA